MLTLTISFELLMGLIRRASAPAGKDANWQLYEGADLPDPEVIAATDPMLSTARERYAAVLSTGELPSLRALRRDLSVGAPRAKRIRAELAGQHTTNAESAHP
ncbi:hypothetical protein Psi02_76050 [Planotetraspora silvatica]|uniref:Uncharacterized protein n=1 Tax=Planotetraspora silvatica TaxID=234614 RepID=A0A8J3UXB8_9ACTN|nr:hypothetical protein Psi02_76050 [Planotetraspora silvatica]